MYMATIIAIANQKGGVGKTTTTINLGAYLARLGKKVLVIDLDPQGNTTSGLGVNRAELETCLYDVILSGADIIEVSHQSTVKNLHITPATNVLASAEVELVNQPSREFKLRMAIDEIQGLYDYILIDCPPSLGLLTLNGLVASHHVLIPVQSEYYALEGLTQLLNTINLVKQRLNNQLDVMGIVMTMFNPSTSLSKQVHDEVKKHLNHKVFDTIIPRNIRLAEAPSYGQTILEYDKWSKGARGYKNLAKEVLKRAKQSA